MDAGTAGGIAGSVIGLMGGVVGTYFGLVSAKGPRERAVAVRLATLCWACIGAMFVWMLLAPRPWNQAAILFNLSILLSIPRMNRLLERARAEDDPGPH